VAETSPFAEAPCQRDFANRRLANLLDCHVTLSLNKTQPTGTSARVTKNMATAKSAPADPYRDDLAFIHDAGFGHVAQNAAGELLKRLAPSNKRGVPSRLIVDLGCGSGILAGEVAAAGYEVLGFDLSIAMLELAAKRVPRATFRRESFLTADFPPCLAVAAIGEVFNYLFDARNPGRRLSGVFSRIHKALCPGGVFLFDLAEPGRVRGSGPQRGYTEGPDWACLYAAQEDRQGKTLTRTITTFRKTGENYRRHGEVHRLRLYPRAEVLRQLSKAGFEARALSGYARFRFPAGWAAFLARKPVR
jgi:SAM-dependent methyltransferase